MSQIECLQLFSQHLSSTLSDEELNDVTFSFNRGNAYVDEKQDVEPVVTSVTVKANRGLLCVLSPVFRSMFKNGMKESLDKCGAVAIDDASPEPFKVFIEYFYGIAPQITAQNIGPLTYLAEKYLVSGLQKICGKFLSQSMSISSIIPILITLHVHRQHNSFAHCRQWMVQQATQISVDEILALFKGDTFLSSHHVIVGVLLSGFGSTDVIDAALLWQFVLKWSQIYKHGDEQKEEHQKANASENPLWFCKNLMFIRKDFPFYRLSMHTLCTEIIPLGILTQEMSIEILTHKTNGYYRMFSRHCIEHKSLIYDKPSTSIGMQFAEHNFDKFTINAQQNGTLSVANTGAHVTLFSSVAMTAGNVYEWTVCVDRLDNANWQSFGMDVVDDARKGADTWIGSHATHSYGVRANQSNVYFSANNSNKHQLTPDGIAVGSYIVLRYNAIEGTLRVSTDKQQFWTFTGIDTKQTFSPSFRVDQQCTLSVSDVRL